MSQEDVQKALKKLVTRLRKEHGDAPTPDPAATPEPVDGLDPMAQSLVYAFMLWEASAEQARVATAKLLSDIVDLNELRVCLPSETVALIGSRYPRAIERCERLRRVLNALWQVEHQVTLEHLTDMSKRNARTYLDELDGMTPFVSARLALVTQDAHAAPMDERLTALLVGEGVVEAEESEKVSSKLERVLRAGEAMEFYTLLERWSASSGDAPAQKTTKKPAAKKKSKSTKKTAKKQAKGASAKRGEAS